MFLYKRYLEKENSNKAPHIVQTNTVRKDGEGSRHYLSHQVGARQEIQFGHVVVWSVCWHVREIKTCTSQWLPFSILILD